MQSRLQLQPNASLLWLWQILKFVRCPINKPNSKECKYELFALKSNKKTPYNMFAIKITDIPWKENSLLCTNS